MKDDIFLTVAMYFKNEDLKLTIEVIGIEQTFQASVNTFSDIFKNTVEYNKITPDEKKISELLCLNPKEKAVGVYLGDSENNIKATFNSTNKITSKYLDDCGESGATFELIRYKDIVDRIKNNGSKVNGIKRLDNLIISYKDKFRRNILDNV